MATNRLIEETSPYLLQHAHNPVDWYPWGQEALESARREVKPLLLSIGYAACHWCHVMERESFEDAEIAALMNEKFICIKVDREERPDIDAIYMDAVQAMTGHGGWPMTMFLTPEGMPFYGGTYFPPNDQHGLPSFRKVLEAVSEAWEKRTAEVTAQGRQLVDHIRAQTEIAPSSEPLTGSLTTSAAQRLKESFDAEHGGFGAAPKFPQAPLLEFVLRAGEGGRSPGAEMADLTLTKMALGGMYDQVGGGFHRYSVDREWLVPHFEKMLYDNAQLARVYTHAWQATGKGLYRRVAVEVIEYLVRDMRDPEGAFYSSEDADSEGGEGKFYVWDYNEFKEVAPESAEFYRVTAEGNFEGLNILTAAGDEPPEHARDELLRARSGRMRPSRDQKILTSWNGLAIAALAEAGATFSRPDFIEAAAGAASFLLEYSRDSSGRLLHSFKDGRAKVTGLLEDYAFLAEGTFTLWEVTFDPRWINECRRLCDEMLSLFWDGSSGGFFTTGADHEQLIVRQKEIAESATPSPNGIGSLVLQKLSVVTGDPELATRGIEVLRLARPFMDQIPQAVPSFLSALDFYLSTPKEIAVVGDRSDKRTIDLLGEIWTAFIPNKVVAGAPPGIESPLLEGKVEVRGSPTAYVCENYSCKMPATEPKELAAQLR